MQKIVRGLVLLALAVLGLSAPAAAQMRPFKPTVINPFAAPQGSVRQLVTATSADYVCQAPAAGANGYVPRNGALWPFLNLKLGMSNGMTWNHETPYAVCLGTDSDYVRFELRDTPFDHGQNDAAKKRRAEIGIATNSRNGVTYWFAYSNKTSIVAPNGLKNVGETQFQWQDPKGSSPSFAIRLVFCKTSPSQVCLRATTRYDEDGKGGDTVTRGVTPYALGIAHNIVTKVQTGGSGLMEAYLDGQLFASYVGPIGTTQGDGYDLRLGTYGAPLSGMTIVSEYKNINFPTTNDLSGRIGAAPAL